MFVLLFLDNSHMIMSHRNGERLLTSVVNDKWECAAKNYSWVNSKITFDHVGHAYLALFQVVGQTYYTALLERKCSLAGIPRYCTDWFMILQELVHDFPIFV